MPVTVGPLRASGVPSLESCADTISSDTSDSTIAEFNSTVQITVTEDAILIGLDGILVTDTEAMDGTEKHRSLYILRRIKAWDMQFCVKNMVIQNSLYLEKSLRYVYQTWFFDCWYLNLI